MYPKNDANASKHQCLEKTLEFAPGEWLLSSYIATGM